MPQHTPQINNDSTIHLHSLAKLLMKVTHFLFFLSFFTLPSRARSTSTHILEVIYTSHFRFFEEFLVIVALVYWLEKQRSPREQVSELNPNMLSSLHNITNTHALSFLPSHYIRIKLPKELQHSLQQIDFILCYFVVINSMVCAKLRRQLYWLRRMLVYNNPLNFLIILLHIKLSTFAVYHKEYCLKC